MTRVQSEPFHPLQKGLDVFFVAFFDFLGGDDPSVFIFENHQTRGCAERKELVKVALRDRLLFVQQLDHLIFRRQRVADFINPTVDR